MHDREFWNAILASDYAVPERADIWALTEELLGYLGNPDPELRDGIGYTVIAVWTMRGTLTTDHLRTITQKLLPNLNDGLGEFRGDKVLLRSFSALVLSVMAYGEYKRPYLTREEYVGLVEALGAYLKAEIDLRGHDAVVGWIHATAHTADWIGFLARSPQADAESIKALLMVIADKLIIPTAHVYTHNEDQRLANAIDDLLKREMLTPDALKAFVARLLKVHEMGTDSNDFDPTIHATTLNVKHFVSALYILLTIDEPIPGAHNLVELLREALKTFTA